MKNDLKKSVQYLVSHRSGNMAFKSREDADNYVEKFVASFGCSIDDLHLYKLTIVELKKDK